MKQLIFLLSFLFIIPAVSAQERINITSEENATLNKNLKDYYSKKDSLEIYLPALERVVEKEKSRLRFETSLHKTVLEYYVEELVKKYNIDRSIYEFEIEDQKWFFRRRVNGDNSGS